MAKKKQKEIKPEPFSVVKKTEFNLVYVDNIKDLIFALAKSGYFIKLKQNERGGYFVEVYTHNYSVEN